MKKLITEEFQKRICNYAPADNIRSINRQIASLQRQIKISQNKDLTVSVLAFKEKNYLYERINAFCLCKIYTCVPQIFFAA